MRLTSQQIAQLYRTRKTRMNGGSGLPVKRQQTQEPSGWQLPEETKQIETILSRQKTESKVSQPSGWQQEPSGWQLPEETKQIETILSRQKTESKGSQQLTTKLRTLSDCSQLTKYVQWQPIRKNDSGELIKSCVLPSQPPCTGTDAVILKKRLDSPDARTEAINNLHINHLINQGQLDPHHFMMTYDAFVCQGSLNSSRVLV